MAQQPPPIRVTKQRADEGLALILQFNALMGDLATLKPGQRKRLSMMGPMSDPFARGVMRTLQANPDIVPRSLDVDRAAAELETLDHLVPLLEAWQQTLVHLQDTVDALGAGVMKVANQGMKLMKAHGKERGLEGVIKELSFRHAKSRRKKAKPEPAKPDGEVDADE
jgi:hypothetical protein